MRPEELLDAVGMIKDEYIDEAAPKAKVTALPARTEESTDEKAWRERPRRRPGWMRYGSVAAAAALLVIVFGVTQLGGRINPDMAASDSGSAEKAEEIQEMASEQSGADGSSYSAPEGAPGVPADNMGETDMINPMQEITRDIMAEEDGVIVTLPEGASDDLWFRYDMAPPIDEVRFVYEGRNVDLRVMEVDGEPGIPMSIESFTGLYYDWAKGVQAVYDNDRGGFYSAVDRSEGAAVLYWYSGDGYHIISLSVSDETIGDADSCIDSLIRVYNGITVEVKR